MIPDDAHLQVKDYAAEYGFDLCRIARTGPITHAAYHDDWLKMGRAGSMEYLHQNVNLRRDSSQLFDGAASAIVVALSYHQEAPPQPADRVNGSGQRGRVAMYAWGRDYHRLMKKKLRLLADRLRSAWNVDFESRACVDTVPVTERELAAAAGIGWIGKNTLVLNRELGSYFFIGVLITSLDLAPDEAVGDHCGSCTACLDACPTGAFPAPYEMDATRCISYLTIEHRGEIDENLRPGMDDWVFGCDVCQEVCPFNRHAAMTREPGFSIRDPGPFPELDRILNWSDKDFADELRGSAAKRATKRMWQRNARIAQQNVRIGPTEHAGSE